jgi:hypothetical protein
VIHSNGCHMSYNLAMKRQKRHVVLGRSVFVGDGYCDLGWEGRHAHSSWCAQRRSRAIVTAQPVLSVWSSGMILPLGGRGPEFKSRYGPPSFAPHISSLLPLTQFTSLHNFCIGVFTQRMSSCLHANPWFIIC